MSKYDHIVIGAGIVGSCTALELAKKGRKVLLLEQFRLPHTRGSSHGATRMTRSCYPEPYFASMMPDALRLWEDIENSSGSAVIVRCGVLCLAETKSQIWKDSLEMMKLYSPESITLLSIDELREKYPMVSYPHDYSVFLDTSGGAILANKALSTVQDLYKRHGGHIWDGCRVLKIEPGDVVRVQTSDGFVSSPSVVICTGTWSRKLLSPQLIPKCLPLEPTSVRVFYWKEKEFGKYTIDSGFPAFIDLTSESKPIYGLPSLEYPSLVKVCVHGGVPCDPDERDKVAPDESLKLTAEEYIREHLPGLEATPSVVEHCMYTVTPDDAFVIDRLPDHRNIILGTGFCGTGFKFSPVVGKLLRELAMDQAPSHDLSHFRLSRFDSEVKG